MVAKAIDAVALDGLNLRLGLGQRFADGLHQGLDRGFTLLQHLRGVGLLTGEPFARQLQEHLAVALQALAREFAEHALQLLAGARQRLFALRAQRLLGLEPRAQQFRLDGRCPFAARAPDQHRERAERGPQQQRRPGRNRVHTRPLASSQPNRSEACSR